jgi:hypothetical protein
MNGRRKVEQVCSLSSEPEWCYATPAGRIRTPPPERRIHPAAPVKFASLPDESGVPVGVATSLGGGAGAPTPAQLFDSLLRTAFATGLAALSGQA